MAIVRAITISCDYCHTELDDPHWTVAECRENARAMGWGTRSGLDICEDCKGL